jgi:hypothetical protein
MVYAVYSGLGTKGKSEVIISTFNAGEAPQGNHALIQQRKLNLISLNRAKKKI